ncbi:hypothetical protein [Salinirussus salinus]|uniref:hypothetical protein n=1 Tax=Salinirussus salinus TaxID=1198300 RepID=UPI0013596D0E|nr:hypothetical protein [Salinirussus salinus]
MELIDYVRYEGLHRSVEGICSRFDAAGRWDCVRVSAALHFYVRHSVENREFDGEVKDFKEILHVGGDCREKSVFLASLLSHVSGVQPRFVEIQNSGEDYVFLQASFPDKSPEEVTRALKQFYHSNLGEPDAPVVFEERDDVFWFFADAFLGTYLGAISGLQNTPYMEVEEDGSYSFYGCDVDYVRV